MEQLKIAFCDDDAAFRALMRPAAEAALLQKGLRASCVEAGSASELSSFLGHMDFDLIFLDIDIPGMDGIRFGESLRAMGCEADIIYVSNMAEKVYEIFRVHPWSFIRKSHFAQEIAGVMAEYAASRQDSRNPLILSGTDGGKLAVEPRDIVYVEAVGKNQRLFSAASQSFLYIHSTLHELEQSLQPHGFIRVHKGFLVNYRCIGKITSRSVLLDSGQDIPLGRDRVKSVRESYLALMKWKGLNRTPIEPQKSL